MNSSQNSSKCKYSAIIEQNCVVTGCPIYNNSWGKSNGKIENQAKTGMQN